MPWFTYPFNDGSHSKMKAKYDIVGVPVVLVLDAATGFLISKKGQSVKIYHTRVTNLI